MTRVTALVLKAELAALKKRVDFLFAAREGAAKVMREPIFDDWAADWGMQDGFSEGREKR